MTEPNPVDLIIANVRDYVARSDSKTQVASAAKVDEKTVRQVPTPKWNPRVRTLRKFVALLPRGWKAGDPLPEQKSKAA